MPVDDTDLETLFSASEYAKVRNDDNQYVRQCATGRDEEFTIFLWKNQNSNNTDAIKPYWKGKTDVAPSSSTVYLQVYNRNTSNWDTVDSDNATAADTEFELEGNIQVDVGYYYDASYWVAFRVYQEAK